MTRRFLLVVALALAGGCAGPPAVGTIAGAIAVSPFTYDFGSWGVGETSTARLFIVSPEGLEYDVITGIVEACDDFDLDLSLLEDPAEVYRECIDPENPAAFAPPVCFNHTQRFTATFHPSFAGPQSCQIAIVLQSGGELPLTVYGTGLAPPVALTLVTPGSSALDFGDVVVGTQSAPLPVTIRNDGTEPIDLTDASISGPDAAAFVLTTTDTEPLGQGQTFTWQVTCTPPAPTALSATLTITSNAPTQTIGLSCNGIQSNLTVSPSPVQFGETLLGATRVATLQLGNSGGAPLTITSTQVTAGPFTASDLAGVPVDPLGIVTLDVTFTPTAQDVGTDVRGSLLITFNGGADSRTIDLVGPARDATLSLTPASAIDFGTVCAGQTREQLFVAVNSGSGAVNLLDAAVSGPGFVLTPIAPPSFPAPLPARGAGSATFRITAAPPTGDATGELVVTTAIPGSAPTVIALHAFGQNSGIGASPLAIDFGGVVVSEPSGGRTVRISNCNPTPLELTSASVTGPNAAEFVLVSADQTLPTTLPPGGNALFIVELRPTVAGDKIATLEVVHTGGVTAIPLTGIGIDDVEPGGGGDRGSYYACSAGGGAGLAPLAGALALLLRRRRRQS